MDAGRPRGDGWSGDDFSASRWSNESDEGTRGDRSWRARGSGRPRPTPAPRDEPADWSAQDAGPDSSGYSFDSYHNRLFSGPSAELYGASGFPHPTDPEHSGGFAADQYRRERLEDSSPSLPSLPSFPRQPGSYEEESPAETSGLVRPYFRTKGRTRPDYDLAIEALISTSEQGRMPNRVKVPEHKTICDLCLDTRSVAEVAALLRLPLGVVRVLIGDVAGLGLVLIHSASSAVGDRPSIEFMERVLSGLRRI